MSLGEVKVLCEKKEEKLANFNEVLHDLLVVLFFKQNTVAFQHNHFA